MRTKFTDINAVNSSFLPDSQFVLYVDIVICLLKRKMKAVSVFLFFFVFPIDPSSGQSQVKSDNPNTKSFRQMSCVENSPTTALCPYWPNGQLLRKDVISLTVTMTSIQRVDALMIANLGLNLFVLQMPKCNISEIESNAFYTLTSLKEINMSGNRLTRIPTRLFANTRAIAKIDFSNNNLELLDNSLFQELQNLNVLNLSGNRLVYFPENLPRVLTYLNLENNMISQIDTHTKLTNLQHLNLCQNRISSFNFFAMECSKLYSLCLDDGVVRLIHKDLRQLNDLQEFAVKGQKSKNEKLGIDHIGSIGGCKGLRKLKIERCDLVTLDILTQFAGLETLELKEVYTEGQLSPAFFNGCSYLETLDLTGSPKLAQAILGNLDIRIKFQKLHKLTVKDCDLLDLNWIPDRTDVPSANRPLPFPSLSNVDISGNNRFDCQDESVKQALCRFDNLKRNGYPETKIVNRNFILENPNTTNCRQQMSTHSILLLNFNNCQETESFSSSALPGLSTPPTTVDETVTDEIFKPRNDDNGSNKTVYIVLVVIFVILLIVLGTILCVYFRKRRSQTVAVPECMTKQSFDNPQTIQSEV
ncbi:leucine-rich repeats and immunoglobulin-like domains protein 1 [Daphnia carinata]|uniref:leucine-rich repeats and immunoglobulin-like domains protein 1 n=1 Tax=Daphnia carinata TaxID=120202 RepID=UPI0028697EC1|nr:leucine-rich repeats and immunoglobulin-like domains protein 1 [Daphnia carinata]